MRIASLAPIALSLALAACKQTALDRQGLEVEPQRAVTAEGLVVIDLLPGIGAPAARGDRVRVEYTLSLADGRKVDSSRDRGRALELVIGDAPLACLDAGLVGMREGGRRKLISPPELAYGTKGVPGLVPPNAELTVELELVAIERP
jgi:peptidylprolyl isomerase